MHRFPRIALIVFPLVFTAYRFADDADDASFAKLWEQAKEAPEKADYKAIRAAFVKTSKYQPYGIMTKEFDVVKKAIKSKDIPAAIAGMDVILEKKPLDVDAHIQAAFLHSEGGDKKIEEMHKSLAAGLAKAIVEGHKGVSFDDAIPVIAVDEEYFVLKILKFQSKGHSLREHEGRRYDVHNVESPDFPGNREVYFDVTIPMNALAKMLKPKK